MKELKIIGEPEVVQPVVLPTPIRPEISFDAWWLLTQTKYGFAPYMKEVIYKHFNARGFLVNKRFDEGLTDFGMRS